MDNLNSAAPITEINADTVSKAISPAMVKDMLQLTVPISVFFKDDMKLKDNSVSAIVDGDLFPVVNKGIGFCNVEIDAEGFGMNATEAFENLKSVLPPKINFVFNVDLTKGKSIEEIDADVKKRVDQYKAW